MPRPPWSISDRLRRQCHTSVGFLSGRNGHVTAIAGNTRPIEIGRHEFKDVGSGIRTRNGLPYDQCCVAARPGSALTLSKLSSAGPAMVDLLLDAPGREF